VVRRPLRPSARARARTHRCVVLTGGFPMRMRLLLCPLSSEGRVPARRGGRARALRRRAQVVQVAQDAQA
jgi:hypothetical protein